MSDFSIDFDLNDIPAPAAYGVLPAGEHRGVVTDVELRDDFEGTGKTAWVKISFLDGELQNRKTVAFIDYHSATEWKQRNGRQMVSALRSVSGLETVNNWQQFVTGQPIGIVIGHYKSKAGETKDKVTGFCEAPTPANESDVSLEDSPF